ncbi:class I mannose-6-phosphate isomerase [Alistipes sp. OttesenSCG-928-B03]|nr:class I mannose-6-phosphate isomerase [Alistipes sp. OttesenSCG-928-B03]
MLYPLKFRPLLKERLWGGDKLRREMGKDAPEAQLIGESWEVSGVQGDLSVVANGFLAGNDLQELAEIYMGELVGDSVYAKYGDEFPVLVKLIDAADDLSVQVHPNDQQAEMRHGAYGKTEMWYVIDAEPDAVLYVGFRHRTSREEYLRAVDEGTVAELLNRIEVKPGDAYFIPAGTIHAIGRGLLLAEIQQTSDITYRVYDWGRTDENGQPRELHTGLAVETVTFGQPGGYGGYDITRRPVKNTAVEMAESPYFTTNLLDIEGDVQRDFHLTDSFVVYVCVDGECLLRTPNGGERIRRGETVMLPAVIDEVTLSGRARLLEVYMDI